MLGENKLKNWHSPQRRIDPFRSFKTFRERLSTERQSAEFDVVKPVSAMQAERLKPDLGVMCDDVIAGIPPPEPKQCW